MKRFKINNSHWQTIWPLYLTKMSIKVDYFRERIDTLDADFLDLDWVNYDLDASPTLILIPGLEGGSDSHYAKRTMAYIKSIGWRGVVIHARGCGGELNKTLSFYHGGWTVDIKHCLNHVSKTSKGGVFIVGVSLGGNALLKLLAEDPDINYQVRAAIAISVPFDLSLTSHTIDNGLNKFLYLPYFLNSLLPKMKLYATKHHALRYDENVKTMHKFNDHYITQLGGFKSAEEYYTKSSSIDYIEDISVPTLIIQANNDPMIPKSCWPRKINNSKVKFRVLTYGGHAGFLRKGFNLKKALFDLPKQMVDYFEEFI